MWSATDNGLRRIPEVTGFWISHLYSPWKTLTQIVATYLLVKDDTEQHKTFVNTNLAELWEEKGETPDEELLWSRREDYPCNEDAVVPERGLFLTCAVDVQESPARLEYEVVAWGRHRENWSIAYGTIQVFAENGQPLPVTSSEVWDKLNDDVLQREFEHASGNRMAIRVMAIDTGKRPKPVYEFATKHAKPAFSANGLRIEALRTVVPIKGDDDKLRVISGYSREDASRKRQNIRIVRIGTHCVKQDLYDLLRDVRPREDGEPSPRCHHFPDAYDKPYFEGLCSEIRISKESGEVEWKKRPNIRNEPLDLKVYNRGAAVMIGIDRFGEKEWRMLERSLAPENAIRDAVAGNDRPNRRHPLAGCGYNRAGNGQDRRFNPMALTAEALQARRDALFIAMTSGRKSVTFSDGRNVTYQSMDEMRQALSLLDSQISTTTGRRRVRRRIVTTVKGL